MSSNVWRGAGAQEVARKRVSSVVLGATLWGTLQHIATIATTWEAEMTCRDQDGSNDRAWV